MYNLLDEEWIPVLWRDGTYSRVGIKKALTDAHRIRQIAASNPMDRFAVFRFLLAVLYWCKGNPPEEMPDKAFPGEWFAKLEENRECFELLGEGKRFYQEHAIDPNDKEKRHAVTPLIHEIPNGDDKWHFRHATDKVNGLCHACCALGLIRLPLYSTGEGRGWHQGINGIPPIYILPIGTNLFHTLHMNWVYGEVGESKWSNTTKFTHSTEIVSILRGLTELPRRVWLSTEINGICVQCGEKGHIITTCEYQDAGSTRSERWNDPNVIYNESEKIKKSLIAPDLSKGDFKSDRPWLDLAIGLAHSPKFWQDRTPIKLSIIGFGTNKAKNVDVWERDTDLHYPIFKDIDLIVEQWKWQTKDTTFRTRISDPRRQKMQNPEIRASIASIRPHVENKVSSRLDELLAGNEDDWKKAAAEYEPMMRLIAGAISPGYTTASLEKRARIVRALPDMRTDARQENKRGDNK